MSSATSDGKTHFAFKHGVFSLDGSYFDLDNITGKARFHMPLGEMMAAIELKALNDEFKIDPGSSDGELLEVVESSLKYVHQIRVNDAIPTEILDGSASWAVQDAHRQVASDRIDAQLITWVDGQEEVIRDLARLSKIANNREAEAKINKAYVDLAKRLKLGDEGREKVVTNIGHIKHELAYIAALYDTFGEMRGISAKLKKALRAFDERDAKEDIDRILALMTPALGDIDMQFEQLEASTCEIVTVMGKFDEHVALIRQTRDDLHNNFMIWQELLDLWPNDLAADKSSDELHRVIKKTYQFAAKNCAQVKTWASAAG